MIELKLIQEFPQEIIAVDEVGRGPLSGPVVIGAIRLEVNDKESFCSLLKNLRQKGIKDSKLISPELRQEILLKLNISPSNFRQTCELSLKSFSISYLTWEMDHEVIDRENILAASLRGMKEASLHLSKKKNIKTTILIDGNHKFRWDKTPSPFNELPIIKGDSLSVLIGLASIIAKEKRDIYMKEMHELYPQYGFKNHFGYPTKEHREAIKLFGPSPIHRRTFKGVREYSRS